MRTLRTLGLVAALGAVAGCYKIAPPEDHALSSFAVKVKGLYLPRATPTSPRVPLPVLTECSRTYGADSEVPPDIRGTPDCRYIIPHGDVEVDLEATALDADGNVIADLNRPISFRVVPGDLTGNYSYRWAYLNNGVATATIKVAHLYSETRFWAEDAPPKAMYSDGGVVGADGGVLLQDGGVQMPDGTVVDAAGAQGTLLPPEPPDRTFVGGVSPAIWFEEPTLAKVQYPDNLDNRSSPFVGQFITVGKNPESGQVLRLDCPDDAAHNGQVSALLVTGIDPAGFFVTDLNACRLKEDKSVTRIPEPDGYYPGTFGSMYVYNYNYPDGLYQGDLLWTVSGSIQEFTSTTQMTFASWSLRERVRLLPESEWDKYLKLVRPVEINARLCNLDTAPFLTDALCGQNKASMKMESLESALVKLRNVKFPEVFTNCDLNADTNVPFFCETKDTAGNWYWGACGPTATPDPDLAERTCNIDCTIGLHGFAGQVCSELSTYKNFNQFVVELPGPGPLEANLDPSIPQRMQSVTVSATPARTTGSYVSGAQVKVWCPVPVHYRFGASSVTATSADPLLPANTVLEHTFVTGEFKVGLLADGTAPAPSTCIVGENPRTRINLILHDVLPDLNVACDVNDPDSDVAQDCKNLRGARYDVVGHLRHVQPARPRWMVMPRDADDVCCHPGPGLSCPKLIKPCP